MRCSSGSSQTRHHHRLRARQPAPAIADATFAGKPSIKITNLTPDQTVSGAFDVDVRVSNDNVNCDLEAKADAAGYGYWHLNADSMTGGMMGMGTMMRMGCSNPCSSTTTTLR